MQKFKIIISLLILAIIAIGAIWFILRYQTINNEVVIVNQASSEIELPVNTNLDSILNLNTVVEQPDLTEPVSEFQERITLKPFGVLIDLATSPVQPERFSGYHNGIDVEFTDTDEDIPVYAIAPGTVLVARIVSGYGGVLVIRHDIDGESVSTLYGHMLLSSLPSINSEVQAGDQIGILGTGGTSETDFERHHLHFAMLKGETIDYRGYVQSEDELAGWYDPLSFY